MGKQTIIQIDVIQDTQVVLTFRPPSKAEAAKIYFEHSANVYEYTRLTVGKRAYTTAQAERFFEEFTKERVPRPIL